MDDIPRSVILVLLIITVLISVLGTWTVMDQLSSTKVPVNVQPAPNTQGGGLIRFHAIDPNTLPEPQAQVGTNGIITFKVEEPKEEV